MHIAFPFLIKQVHAIAKPFVFIKMATQIGMAGKRTAALIAQRHFTQRLFGWALRHEIKLPCWARRAVQRAGQTVKHIHALKHFHRKRGC